MTAFSSYNSQADGRDEPVRRAPGGTHSMWQIHAMMAKVQIDEQLHEAEERRLNAQVPRPPRRHRRIHLPSVHRHPVRPTSRSI